MSTTYDATPTVQDRVIGSDLIVLATIKGPVQAVPIEDAAHPRVHGWFEVDIRETLSGEQPPGRVTMRVIGEGHDGAVTWPVPVPSEEPLLCFLTRDIGPGLPDQLFAPCHNGLYALSADGVAQVPDSIIDDAARELTGAGRAGIPIVGIRRLIDARAERYATETRHFDEHEPVETRDASRSALQEYPRSAREHLEATLATPGGGQPAELG
jgi:hypothetical protein